MRVVTRAPTRPDPAAVIPHPREPSSAPSSDAQARAAEDKDREDEDRAREDEERENEAREREAQEREAQEREAQEREAQEREAQARREAQEREARARAAEAQAQAETQAREFQAQARAEQRWTRERPVFDQAEAAVRWAIVGNDLHGAWESLAVLESTDPPGEFHERAVARRRQVEALARRCARGATPHGTSLEPAGYAAQVAGLRRTREDAARGEPEAEVSGHATG
jgi:hypothetical protein